MRAIVLVAAFILSSTGTALGTIQTLCAAAGGDMTLNAKTLIPLGVGIACAVALMVLAWRVRGIYDAAMNRIALLERSIEKIKKSRDDMATRMDDQKTGG